MSEANAEELRVEEEIGLGVSIRSARELRADERRDTQETAEGWYGTGKHRGWTTEWGLWRPHWAKIAGQWNVPDYLKVSAAPQE